MIRLSKSVSRTGFRRFTMQRSGFGKVVYGGIYGLAAIVALTAPATTWIPRVSAADVTAATSASTTGSAISQGLRRILDGNLDGNSPLAVGDLRAMQGHVRSLSQQLKKCTVGVQVDNERG